MIQQKMHNTVAWYRITNKSKQLQSIGLAKKQGTEVA